MLQSGSCTKAQLGYSLSTVAGGLAGNNKYVNLSADRATKALILHPIAAGLAFIAQIIALASVQIGFLFASLFVLLAFFVALGAMVLDFALFGIIRNAINHGGNDLLSASAGSGKASYSTATWLVLGATISLLLAVIMTLFACCCGGDRRREKRHEKAYASNSNGYVGSEPGMVQTSYAPQRKHWWNRRNRNAGVAY